MSGEKGIGRKRKKKKKVGGGGVGWSQGRKKKKKKRGNPDNSFSVQSGWYMLLHDGLELLSLCPNVPVFEAVLKYGPNIFLYIVVDNWEFSRFLTDQEFIKIAANIVH